MLTLPIHITYNTLKSFWIVFNLVVFITATILGIYYTGSWYYLGILLFTPATIYPGLLNPEWILKPYIYVNAVLKRLTRLLRYIVLLIVQYILLSSLRLTGKKLSVSDFPPNESMWQDKYILNLAGEKERHTVSIDPNSNSWWVVTYYKWVRETKKWWLLTVIPFMMLLSILSDSKEQQEVATDTYTLY